MVHSIHRFVRATIYRYFRTSLIRRSQFHTTMVHKSQTQNATVASTTNYRFRPPSSTTHCWVAIAL